MIQKSKTYSDKIQLWDWEWLCLLAFCRFILSHINEIFDSNLYILQRCSLGDSSLCTDGLCTTVFKVNTVPCDVSLLLDLGHKGFEKRKTYSMVKFHRKPNLEFEQSCLYTIKPAVKNSTKKLFPKPWWRIRCPIDT